MRFVVDVAYAVALLVVGPFYWLRRRLKGKRLLPIRARLGGIPALPADGGPVAWVHAVSVGEVLAARGLIARLAAGRPDLRFVVTTTTAAGFDVARATYPDRVVLPSPLDFSFAVRRFFDRLAPAALVLVELELWPNLLREARRRGVPTFVVNARISPRSFGRYRLLARLWPGFLAPVDLFLAQDAEHAARLAALGVGAERVVVAGDLKFDNAEPTDPTPDRRALRSAYGWADADPVLVAGSTHRGEEEVVLAAMARVRRRFPTARLVLAPRHRERIPEVTALLTALQFAFVRRSDDPKAAAPDVILVDTTGELVRFYAAGDVAFVGGSLVPVGGHNLLEPAVFGRPVVTGPHLRTVRETARLFAEAGALVEVKDAESLASVVEARFADPAARGGAGRRAQELIASRRGASARCAEAILAGLRRDRGAGSG